MTDSTLLTFKEFAGNGIRQAASFVYETPIIVPAALVSGIALHILYPTSAPPFFGFSAAIILARLVVKVVEIYNDQSIKDMKELVFKTQLKVPKMEYIALAISLLIVPIFPVAAVLCACSAGIYKGFLIEIEVYQLKQLLDRAESPLSSSSARKNLMNV